VRNSSTRPNRVVDISTTHQTVYHLLAPLFDTNVFCQVVSSINGWLKQKLLWVFNPLYETPNSQVIVGVRYADS